MKNVKKEIEQGLRDSNPRVQESKSCALPLGESPMFCYFTRITVEMTVVIY